MCQVRSPSSTHIFLSTWAAWARAATIVVHDSSRWMQLTAGWAGIGQPRVQAEVFLQSLGGGLRQGGPCLLGPLAQTLSPGALDGVVSGRPALSIPVGRDPQILGRELAALGQQAAWDGQQLGGRVCHQLVRDRGPCAWVP